MINILKKLYLIFSYYRRKKLSSSISISKNNFIALIDDEDTIILI